MTTSKPVIIGLILIGFLFFTLGCLSGTAKKGPEPAVTKAPATTLPVEKGPAAGEEHDDEAGEEHAIPHEFEEMMNPVSSSQTSIDAGRNLFTTNCAACHGPEGRGDGTMAMNLDPKPSNLHETHVQGNTDGALFYVISEGVEGTAMPAFGHLSEEDRWDMVNYLRTLEVEEH